MFPRNEHQNEGTFLAWPPLQTLALKKSFLFCRFWAVKNVFNSLRSAGEIFLDGLRGAKNFSVAFRIAFRILSEFFKPFFVSI